MEKRRYNSNRIGKRVIGYFVETGLRNERNTEQWETENKSFFANFAR